jgi:hypothetical protein
MIIQSMTSSYNQTRYGEGGMETYKTPKGFWTTILNASYDWWHENTIVQDHWKRDNSGSKQLQW